MRSLSDEQIIGMLTHDPTVTYQTVGNLAGLSRQRVQQIAKRIGFRKEVNPKNYCKSITIERVLELYHRSLLLKDIAKILGCNQKTLSKRLRLAGISKGECYSRSVKLQRRYREESNNSNNVDCSASASSSFAN